MNNPYRARPARARVDHAAVSGYGSQNQNAWNSMPSESRPGIRPPDVYQQPPNSVSHQQQQQSHDSWDWGTDNGNNGNNDAWNWSVDQKPEPEQQNSQPHQFPSGQSTNSSQSIQNPQSGNYYQNVNKNVRSNVLNQHPGSAANTPRSSLSRESTPNSKDGYNQYMPYDYNQRPPPQQQPQQQQQQQYHHLPPRPNSKSSPALPDHTQWSASSNNSPSLQESVKNIHTPPLPPPTNNYNWHNNGQQVNATPNNWQNYSDAPVSTSWQDTNKQQSLDNVNQWQQSPQISQPIAPTREYPKAGNTEPSMNWNNQRQQQQNNSSNQWDSSYSYSASNEPVPPVVLQNPGATNAPNQWHQPMFQPPIPSEESVSLQSNVSSNQWQQPLARHENVTTNDWSPLQKPAEFRRAETDPSFTNNMKQEPIEATESHKSLNDWQHVQPPMPHFATSTGPDITQPLNSVEKIPLAKDLDNERKMSVGLPLTSSTLVNEAAMQTKSSDESHWPEPDINLVKNNADNSNAAQNNTTADWSASPEWNTIPVSELSNGISQLNLSNNSNRPSESQAIQSDTHSAVPSLDGWSTQTQISDNRSENLRRDSVSGVQPDHFPEPDRRSDNQNTVGQFIPQEHGLSSLVHQIDNNATPEAVPQNAGYDQWYAQRNTVPQPDDSWYRNDGPSKAQKWTPEQNIENYENIQQPAEFVNLEVVAPVLQKRNIYGSHDSINRETLDNEPKSNTILAKETLSPRDYPEDINNVEVPSLRPAQQSLQVEQAPDNYEFASNDRNTFLETGELTDSHQLHEPTPPSQDDENDEVPNDIPFLREVPGQSSGSDPRRNDPTGQEQNIQLGPRISDPRRNDPSGQEHTVQPIRNLTDRTERRDVPPGQERNIPLPPRVDTELLERRNDPSGRERSLPPQQSRNDTTSDSRRNLPESRRNDPSGEECLQPLLPPPIEPTDLREVPGRGIENEEPIQQADSGLRQIPGGASPIDEIQVSKDRDDARVVTGSQEVAAPIPAVAKHDLSNETRSKREEAVGASLGENLGGPGQINRRDSYEEGDDEESGNSRDESRERRKERTPERRAYDYERNRYYDRDRDFDDNYYYERRRGADSERPYNSREELDRREISYRDEERRHTSRDDLDRRGRDNEDADRRGRGKDDVEERRRREDDRRPGRGDVDPRSRNPRDYDSRYFRDREYSERDRRREPNRRGRRYEDYDAQDPYRRDYYEDPYARNSRPSSRSSYNDRDRDYYARSRDPYYGYNAYGGGYTEYNANYGSNYYAYLENMRRTNPAAYMEWYRRYYASQHQQPQDVRGGGGNYPEDRASVHSGRSSCDDRLFENPSIYFHSPNKALYVSYFGSPGGYPRSPLWRHSTAYHSRNRTTGDKRTLGDISTLEDTTIGSTRLTPTKFSTSHVQASFSTGSLVHVHASYPADGELARVDILRVSSLLAHDPVVRELVAYPGPLIKQVGVTHKKTIIEYCEAKIKRAEYNEEVNDPPSYILLYELMVLLIRQNGNVVGVDIAELLLCNQKSYPYTGKRQSIQGRRESVISQKSIATSRDDLNRDTSTPLDTDETGNANKQLSIEQITDQFRELLLYGCGQEALEYAMNNGLWGHALFLASKLDKRTHASVMTRFANGLTANDPLQTLYQLQSGRVPASVTCVSEPKWGDWRPHLAMIISNTSPNPEINRKSITTLGDTLIGRGHVHAAHFCYILAQVDFGAYGVSTSKLVLLGSNPHKSYNEFVTNEAIMLTEIYEYARNLSEPGFTLVDLQTFKYGLAVKMVDYGLTEKALLYIEQIAVNIAREPTKYQMSFIESIHNLGDRIKYNDPVCKDSIEDAANLTWLNNLSEILNKYKCGEIVQEGVYDPHTAPDVNSIPQHQEHHEIQQPQQQWVVAQPEYSDGPASLMDPSSGDVQRDWQPMSLPATIQDPYTSSNSGAQYVENQMLDSTQPQQQQSQMDYWGQQNYSQGEYSTTDYSQPEWQQQQQNTEQPQYGNDQQDNDNVQQEWNYESEKEEKPPSPDPPPTISMGPSSNKQYDPLAELDALDPPASGATKSKSTGENKKANEKQSEKKNNASGGGSWFGGFFSKLAPKPKNQMILPDDSNPTIVWDAIGKKWTNKDADGESSSGALPPPPKASEMGYRLPQPESTPSTLPPQGTVTSDQPRQLDEASNKISQKPPSGNNMFKMPKGSRSLRTNYIDIMNPGGTKAAGVPATVTPPTAVPPIPNAGIATSPQFFIPAPVNDPAAPVDFLTSASAVANGENTQQGLSRWSSASSLSREVQSYTMRDPRLLQQEKGPMMFNPTDVKDSASKRAPRSRYPPR